MKKQSAAVVAALAVLALATALTTTTTMVVAADPAPPPEYTKQEDVRTDFIKQVGKFAVNVYKMGHGIRDLTYLSTSQCWSSPAAGGGNNYWMVLFAANSTGTAGRYVSTVWGIPGHRPGPGGVRAVPSNRALGVKGPNPNPKYGV